MMNTVSTNTLQLRPAWIESNASGVIAAVIGVAGAGVRLSLVLNAVSTDAPDARFEVLSISRSVSLFSLTLKQVGTVLQQNDGVHSPEALHAAKDITDESKLVFDEIEQTLDRARKRRDGLVSFDQRFRWYFRGAKVRYLLGLLESFKLNLSLLLQVLQLGKLMAATSKSDPEDEVAQKLNAIQQERAETQNLVIIRYWQIHEVQHLHEEAKKEITDVKQGQIKTTEPEQQGLLTNGTPTLTIDEPADNDVPTPLIQISLRSWGDIEDLLEPIRDSPGSMIRASKEVIDPLLERWTIWHEVRERRHARHSGSSVRFTPSVHGVNEEEEDQNSFGTSHEREESPQGYYLEGTTTNWRQPHSAAARTEAAQRRKRWSGYQASVSAESSDVDESPGSKDSRRRGPKRGVISSGSSESSDEGPEPNNQQRRKSDDSPTTERRRASEMSAPPHAYSTGAVPNRMPPQPVPPPYGNIRASVAGQHPIPHRPMIYHSTTSPLPPINTANAPNPYSQTSQFSPSVPPPGYPMASQAAYRYAPQGASKASYHMPRPLSREGSSKSPSRLRPTAPAHSRPHKTEEEKRASREKTKRNLGEGVTKGLLGAGAIAGFLEALEGLSI